MAMKSKSSVLTPTGRKTGKAHVKDTGNLGGGKKRAVANGVRKGMR